MHRYTLALLVVLGAGAPARAAFLVQAPTAVGSDYTYNQTGASTLMSSITAGVDRRPSGYAVNAGTKFALGGALAPGGTITAATLTFSVVEAFAAGGNAPSSMLAVSGSGSATTTLALTDFGAATGNLGWESIPLQNFGAGLPTAYTVDVTALVASLYSGGAAGVFFQFDNQTAQTSLFLSPISGYGVSPAAATAPTLTIQFTPAVMAVPEPASALLAAVGLAVAGLGRAGRRHRTRPASTG